MLLAEAQRGTFLIGVNETLNRTTAPALTERSSALSGLTVVRSVRFSRSSYSKDRTMVC